MYHCVSISAVAAATPLFSPAASTFSDFGRQTPAGQLSHIFSTKVGFNKASWWNLKKKHYCRYMKNLKVKYHFPKKKMEKDF